MLGPGPTTIYIESESGTVHVEKKGYIEAMMAKASSGRRFSS
jgi:hypothetical protein